MTRFNTIMVSSCGGDIGTGVGRILGEIGAATTLIGTDARPDHPGEFIFDHCELVPYVDDGLFLTEISHVITSHRIEVVIPTSDAGIRFFQERGIRRLEGASLIMANDLALEVGLDKLATSLFLKKIGVPGPWTHLVKDAAPIAVPCIIKSRFGRGSKGVEVADAVSVPHFTAVRPDDLWQEYLTPDDEEYTCGVYGCKDGSIRTIVFKRRLGGGLTVSGEVVQNPEIEDQLRYVAGSLGLRGSINVQLRLTKSGPRIFEINPRFSSTVVFRHRLGFKDVQWALEELAGATPSPYIPPRVGVKFYKGYTEYISGREFENRQDRQLCDHGTENAHHANRF